MPTPPFAPAARATRSVEEHRAAVAELLGPLPVEEVPLGRARGRVLAEPLVAGVALPPFDNSAMDGYAVRAADVAGATDDGPVTLPVTADIPAGRTDVPALAPGTAHRIMTGAPLPAGADAIVQVEHTDGGHDRVRVLRAPAAGTSVRRAGEDVIDGRGRAAGGHGAGRGADRRGGGRRRGDPAGAPPPDRARAVHRLRTGRARHPAAAGADLRVERPHARRRGGGRRGRRRAAAVRARRRRAPAPRARRAPGGRHRRPRPHLGRDQRGRLRGGQGGPGRPGRRVRQGRDATGRAAGRREGERRRGRRAAREPGQLARVVRGVRASGAAGGPRAPPPRPAA